MGKISVRPLYLTLGARTVRLSGIAGAAGSTKVDTVLGMGLLTPLISGRNALIPKGTPVPALTARTVVLARPGP
jgi:hypothetical protein